MAANGDGGPRPPWRIFAGDTVRGVIGYVVVLGAIASFLVAVFAFGSAEADLVAAFFSSLLGVVMGFFFGRQGIDRAEKETVAALHAKDEVVHQAESVDVDELLRKAEEGKAILAEYERLLELADRQEAPFKRKFNGLLSQLEVQDADRPAPDRSQEDEG